MTGETHSRPSLPSGNPAFLNRQNGMTLIMLVFIVGMAATAYMVHALNSNTVKIERDKKTAAALAEAKAALIGYASGVSLTGSKRPGDMPCPDTDNDGSSNTCSGNIIGRLPWKTLGLGDLRDGNGERLWYAVSTNFKDNPRTGTLNSATNGTLTVRASDGSVINDGTTASGAVAVVLSPGPVLTRQGTVTVQNRGCTVGVDCDSVEKCTAAPVTNTPKCNPQNYLDISGTEDNAVFSNGSTDGFIQGEIKDALGNIIVNDRMIIINYFDLMPLLEKRVANESIYCLKDYAQNNSGGLNRYPWAVPVSNYPSYLDVNNTNFGRIPDTTFDNTRASSANQMSGSWTGNCKIQSSSGWWPNWKELVFYALADSYKPSGAVATACSACLTVSPPSATPDKQVVVLVSGKALGGQVRSSNPDKGTISNYLEAGNAAGGVVLSQQKATATFNDVVVYQ
jgi:hypothetical protein